MAKIILYFPGNAHHSFMFGDRWGKMYNEELGLHSIGKSGIPVTISHQGQDYEFFPFLRDIHNQYPSMDVANAQFSHALLTLPSTPDTFSAWDTQERYGNLPITFFSEFCTPGRNLIPTEFFFVLASQTCSYSLTTGIGRDVSSYPDVASPFAKGTIAARYGDKTGIIIDGFADYLKKFFAFASNPDNLNKDAAVKAFKAMVDDPREYIIVPLDLEQAYVGSVLGEKLWTLLFDALIEANLDSHIVPLSELLERTKEMQLPEMRAPHRLMTKWTVHDVQLKHLFKLNKNPPRTEKQRRLFVWAAGSDLLSSWNRYVLQSQREALSYICKDEQGIETEMHQYHNDTLQNICREAFECLCDDSRSMESYFERAGIVYGDMFSEKMYEYTIKHNI